MPRVKFHTLTEQMFYILLCLEEECYGMDILDKVPEMTGGRVNVGSGTLYNLLEQFLEMGAIRETKVEGRRRSYIITDAGSEMLKREYQRLLAQAHDYETLKRSACLTAEDKVVGTLEQAAEDKVVGILEQATEDKFAGGMNEENVAACRGEGSK